MADVGVMVNEKNKEYGYGTYRSREQRILELSEIYEK